VPTRQDEARGDVLRRDARRRRGDGEETSMEETRQRHQDGSGVIDKEELMKLLGAALGLEDARGLFACVDAP